MEDLIKEYALYVKNTDQFQKNDSGNLFIVREIFCEFWNLMQMIDLKIEISTDRKEKIKNLVLPKLGDLLWYIVAFGNRNQHNFEELRKGKNDFKPNDFFDNLSIFLSNYTNSNPTRSNISDIIENIDRLSNMIESSLDEIININKKKNIRYLEKIKRISDDTFPSWERLPKKINFVFQDRCNRTQMLVKIDDEELLQIGDSLTDNSHSTDNYRFHDIFHIAFYAYLGWSPVLRSLLKRKRKSDPKIDEIEDGARAGIIEESISLYIFKMYEKKSLFVPNENGNSTINFEVLKFIKISTDGLEANQISMDSWSIAIVKMISAFEKIVEWNGGIISVKSPGILQAIGGNIGMNSDEIYAIINLHKSA